MAATPDSKSNHAYETIRNAILAGDYGPGYRLVITSLARDFGVSTLPVREAIRRLEAEGWVVFERNVGARVAEFDADRWLEGMELLAVLDGFATASAAPRCRAQDLARARVVNREMQDAVKALDVARATERNRAFHEVILARCENRTLAAAVQDTWDRLDNMHRSRTFYGVAARDSVAEHLALLDLIEGGASAAKIEQFARRHRTRLVKAYRASQAAA